MRRGVFLICALICLWGIPVMPLGAQDSGCKEPPKDLPKQKGPGKGSQKTSIEPLARFAKPGYRYEGLTPRGLAVLKDTRDAVRQRMRLFENTFRKLTTLHHAMVVARIARQHMFLYGPPASFGQRSSG